MSLLTDFRLSVLERNLGVYGIHVYQAGSTIAEHRFRSNDRENMYSASKTFAGRCRDCRGRGTSAAVRLCT